MALPPTSAVRHPFVDALFGINTRAATLLQMSRSNRRDREMEDPDEWAVRVVTEGITIDRNDETRRYELKLDGELAGYAEYRTNPGRTTFTHTVVFPEHEGKGLGTRLAKFVLDEAVARGDTIVPVCPFIGAYLKRHPGVYDASVSWP